MLLFIVAAFILRLNGNQPLSPHTQQLRGSFCSGRGKKRLLVSQDALCYSSSFYVVLFSCILHQASNKPQTIMCWKFSPWRKLLGSALCFPVHLPSETHRQVKTGRFQQGPGRGLRRICQAWWKGCLPLLPVLPGGNQEWCCFPSFQHGRFLPHQHPQARCQQAGPWQGRGNLSRWWRVGK